MGTIFQVEELNHFDEIHPLDDHDLLIRRRSLHSTVTILTFSVTTFNFSVTFGNQRHLKINLVFQISVFMPQSNIRVTALLQLRAICNWSLFFPWLNFWRREFRFWKRQTLFFLTAVRKPSRVQNEPDFGAGERRQAGRGRGKAEGWHGFEPGSSFYACRSSFLTVKLSATSLALPSLLQFSFGDIGRCCSLRRYMHSFTYYFIPWGAFIVPPSLNICYGPSSAGISKNR